MWWHRFIISLCIIPFRISMTSSVVYSCGFPKTQFRSSHHRSQMSYISVMLILVLLLQVLAPSSAKQYQIPLKRFYSPVVLHVNKAEIGEMGSSYIVRRDVTSRSTSLDLSSMKNNLNGLSGDGYYIQVNIGTPPQTMQVLIDTGSANFAVAAHLDPNISHFFHRENSSTFVDGGKEIYVPYTEGEWRGALGTDVMYFPTAANASTTVNLACITESKAFFIRDAEWQGILGLAFAQLARPDSSYLPVWDSLIAENPDIPDVFSVQLCGSSFVHTQAKPLMEGSLVIGGVEPSMAKSAIFYTPIVKQWYYEIVLTDIHVGSASLGMDCKEYNFDKTIVDSGTTNIRLPTKIFDALVNAIEVNIQMANNSDRDRLGENFYTGEDIICYSDMKHAFTVFPVVSFFLVESENSSFRLDVTPQHYLRPVESVAETENTGAQACVKFGFSPSSSGTVLGAVLMEAFYVVFDRKESRIGFAQTTCPLPDPRNPIKEVTIEGSFMTNKNPKDCAYKKPEKSEKTLLVVSYIMAAMSVVVVLPLVLLFFMWTRKVVGKRNRYQQHHDASETRTVLSDS